MTTLSLDTPSRFRSPICAPGYRAGIPNPHKGKEFSAEILTHAEIMRLLAQTNHGVTGLRTRTIIVTLWRTGMRVGELCRLRPIDIDHEEGTIRILRGKTRNANRTVGADPQCFQQIAKWQEARTKLEIPRLAPLFCTIVSDHKGFPLTTAQVRNTLRLLADKAQIEKRVHPHGFRHTHAAELVKEGVDIRIVSQQLGHSNIAITHRYVSHLWPGAVIDAMQQRIWTNEEDVADPTPEAIATLEAFGL